MLRWRPVVMGVLTPTFVDMWDELIIGNGTRPIIRLICRDQKSLPEGVSKENKLKLSGADFVK